MSMNQAAYGARLRALLPVLLLSALSMAVYLNALQNGFVYDDVDQVLQNAWIRDVRLIPEIFTNNAWGFSGAQSVNYYRPMMHLIYMAEFHLFGLSPLGFHLVNIGFHAGVTILVYFLSVRLLTGAGGHPVSSPAPLAAAALFAVNPVHTEAVTWVAGVPEVSFAFFYLASWLLYIRSLDANGKGLIPSVVLFFVSCLCKETALTLPLVLVCYEHFFRGGGEKFIARFKRYAPFILAALAYLAVRLVVIGGVAPRGRHPELSGYEHIINIFPLFAGYLYKLLLPLNLNAFYNLHPIHSLMQAKGALSVAVAALFAAAMVVAARKNRAVFISLAVILLPLLPVFYIRGLGENTFAERYLYLPSFGVAMLMGLMFGKVMEDRARAKKAAAALVLLLCVYSAGTIYRNAVWRDGYSLWTDTVAKSPDAALPHINLAIEYIARRDFDAAMEQLRTAIKITPYSAAAHNNMGAVYYEKGMLDNAIEEYRMTVSINPNLSNAHNNLGKAYADKGLEDMAMEEYLTAIRLNPANGKAHYNAGELYYRRGQLDEAIQEYEAAISLDPDYLQARNSFGAAYFDKGLLDKAMAEHLAAIGIDPSVAASHYRLGLVYKAMGDIDGAVAEYKMAISLGPSAAIYNNLGNAFAVKGDLDGAIAQYEKALSLEPGYELAKTNLELARELKRAGASQPRANGLPGPNGERP